MPPKGLLRVVVVGAGSIGREFALEHLTASAGVMVSAIVDLDAVAASTLAADVGSTEVGETVVHATSLTDDVLQGCDAVYIGTTPSSHLPLVERALAAEKHVLLEKPLASHADDADRIVAVAERAASRGIHLSVNIGMRYNEALHQMRRLALEQDALGGEVESARLGLHFAQWPREWQQVAWCAGRTDGGPLREVGTHFLAAIHELWGSECVRRVRAAVEYGDGETKAETSVDGTIELWSGVPILLSVTTDGSISGTSADSYELELVGPGGAKALLLDEFTSLRQVRPRRRTIVQSSEYGRKECVANLVAAAAGRSATGSGSCDRGGVAPSRPGQLKRGPRQGAPSASIKKRTRRSEMDGHGQEEAVPGSEQTWGRLGLPAAVTARDGRNAQRVLDAILRSGGHWVEVSYG